jgi:hypothetical protein
MSLKITNILPGDTITLAGKRVDISIVVRGTDEVQPPVSIVRVNPADWVFRYGANYSTDEHCSDNYIRWHTNNAAVGMAPFTWIPYSASTDTAIGVSKVSIMPTGVIGSTANISVEVMGAAPIHVCTVNS